MHVQKVAIRQWAWSVPIYKRFSSSYLTKKLKTINDRALKCHVDYMKSLDILEGKNRSIIKEMYPNKKSEISDLFFLRKNTDDKSETNELKLDVEDFNNVKKIKYEHEMKNMSLNNFGVIKVIHNDILEEDADCMLVPMVSNFIPLGGFGAYILHKGGKELIKEIFIAVKTLIKKRIDILYEHKEEYIKENEHLNIDEPEINTYTKNKTFKDLLENCKTLQIGDIIITKPHNVSSKVKLLAFLIMPFYWQGNSYVASNKLRYCFSNALKQLNELSISSVILPQIAAGMYGYNINNAGTILIEEAVECLLQINNIIPLYNLNSIHFVDSDYNTCKLLSETLEDISRNYLPHKKVLPAPKYWNIVNRRVLDIPGNVVYYCRKTSKISFRKYHGIIRRKYLNYYSNIRPFKWRASRVVEPNPLLLYKQTGETSSYQYNYKPHYYKDISHTLYNINKKGLVGIRVGKRGKIQALKQISNITLETKPRL
ncbi:MACRO domain-containing protein, putative [Hepatocystis sp. ex Piliocolobus tephrosceles]|nr:MACRO domain-containing protein, putative [Hepatocystis sp. ex Piliocolobus tephrosceles]